MMPLIVFSDIGIANHLPVFVSPDAAARMLIKSLLIQYYLLVPPRNSLEDPWVLLV
jgi:hypothetical protein